MCKKLGIAVCVLLIGMTAVMITPAMAEEENVVNVYSMSLTLAERLVILIK